MNGKYYDSDFYSGRDTTMLSAEEMTPIIMETFHPKSAVDVGCGLGEFLHALEKAGVEEVLGIDGPWVDTNALRISLENFKTADLEKPLNYDRKYDIVISSEVAEHISERSADVFVKSLTNLGDVILFSAAIPLQGGTFHVNEQWPQYWANKFYKENFLAIDYIRPKIWNNEKIKFWYKQNLIVFINKDCLSKYPEVEKEYNSSNIILPLIHPIPFNFYAKNYLRITKLIPKPVKFLLKKFYT